ncbi:helix-turn-helix domain-containing protein [Mucilaginibacter sp. RB4R14]|uniref:helix-turn-helix transcriptional regulator n=1 Tax=Mucilaginibacter aurantiaciroseus TaxID=2949308 RepID=UPI002091A842|nr:helix-turn-helix domain-containing protein [Mucilaginibacter aurantiaciroseus]MCO5936134.1 helix-turn-helix domain-containing protein [Mucilaginibacter aurantiaciroseus]
MQTKQICLFLDMEQWIKKYRGINPGAVLRHELKKKKLKQTAFAQKIDLPAQTLNAILRGKRKMTTEVALRIDHELGLEASTMVILQAIYYTKLITQKTNSNYKPDTSRIRKALFWDTDFEKIDWHQKKNAVIQRVWERGNEDEKSEIQHFYGSDIIKEALTIQRKPMPAPSPLRKQNR